MLDFLVLTRSFFGLPIINSGKSDRLILPAGETSILLGHLLAEIAIGSRSMEICVSVRLEGSED